MNGRLDRAVLASVAVGMLVSCGGSSSTPTPTPTPTSTPTPTPTSTPTPTPTPTPTFSYSTFDNLTGDQAFSTACEVFAPRSNGVPVWQAQNVVLFPGNISSTGGNSNWTVGEINGGQVAMFAPENLTMNTAANRTYEVAGFPPQRLTIITPSVADTPAVYGRGVSYQIGSGSVSIQTALCSIGVPTDPDDIPVATTVTYTEIGLGGIVLDENPAGGSPIVSTIVGGTGTITGNTATGELTFSLTFTVRAPGGADTVIGPVTGTTSVQLTDDRAGYFGMLTDANPIYRINGAFYGPQGRETGFIVTAGFDQDNNGENERFVLMGGYARR